MGLWLIVTAEYKEEHGYNTVMSEETRAFSLIGESLDASLEEARSVITDEFKNVSAITASRICRHDAELSFAVTDLVAGMQKAEDQRRAEAQSTVARERQEREVARLRAELAAVESGARAEALRAELARREAT